MPKKLELGEPESKDPQEKLEVASVATTEYRGGIPLPNDLNILAQALDTFAGGVGGASSATRNDYGRTANTSFNVAFHNMDNPRYSEASPVGEKKEGPYSTNPFIDGIVKSVEEAN